MSLDKEIQKGADAAIQRSTGVPAPQLRGLIGPTALMAGFIERTRDLAREASPRFDTEVRSVSKVLEGSGFIPIPASTPVGGGGGGTTGTPLVSRYTDVSSGSPVAATGTFLSA